MTNPIDQCVEKSSFLRKSSVLAITIMSIYRTEIPNLMMLYLLLSSIGSIRPGRHRSKRDPAIGQF